MDANEVKNLAVMFEGAARDCFALEKLDDALLNVQRSLELDASSHTALLLAARIFLGLDREIEALESVNKALTLADSSEALLLKANVLHFVGGQDELAFAIAEDVAQRFRDQYLEAQQRLLEGFMALSQNAIALEKRDIAHAILAESIELGLGKFPMYDRADPSESGRAEFSREDEMDANDLEDLAREEFLKGEYESALKHVIRSIDLDPLRYHAHVLASHTYSELGRADKALESVESALAIEESSQALRIKADVLNELGNHELALELAMKAVSLVKKPFLEAKWELQCAFTALTESAVALGRLDLAQTVVAESIDIGTGNIIL